MKSIHFQRQKLQAGFIDCMPDPTEKRHILPFRVCTYFSRGQHGIGQGCLRVNCKFFHGSEEQLAAWASRERLSCEGGEGFVERVAPRLCDSDLGAKRPIVCLAFLSNSCRRPGCRFLHLPSNVRPLPIAVCECFTRGKCTRKRCRFFHGPQAVLSRMHAQGVTMYNPKTNEPHDPATSLEELMKLQERTTIPLLSNGEFAHVVAMPYQVIREPPPYIDTSTVIFQESFQRAQALVASHSLLHFAHPLPNEPSAFAFAETLSMNFINLQNALHSYSALY